MNRLLLALLLLLGACREDPSAELENGDYLIFGHYYGFCAGESCVEVFKLTGTHLFEDLNDNPGAREPFDFIALDQQLFSEVRDLWGFFPEELLSAKDSVFGCPDCADQGGMLIQYQQGGFKNSWRIDQFRQNVPPYLHEFMDKVNEKIDLLSN